MKKLLLISSLILSLNSSAQALSENFEGGTFPPTGWTIDTQVTSRPWAKVSAQTLGLKTTFLIAGTESAFINYTAAYNEANLISPSFSLAGYATSNFNFKVKVGWNYMINLNAGNLFAKISTDNGSTWTLLWMEEDSPEFVDDGDGDGNSDLYNTANVSIDLAAYLGMSNLKIKFEYIGTDADAVSVDDIVVDGTLSTNDFLSSKFSVYPNPAKNFVTVTSKNSAAINKVVITDINGRTVNSIDVDGVTETQINISELNAGVYFLNIDTNEGTATKKIVKN
ncbi:T9SS type A sorting domain-containing protein [Flavobacterium sp. SM15]|uniref:T9SS type A sorting domain-containing protein n=1 Tax=Flavobacterium sp. SM15 TaxID=2908005 RepID=UPI001EDC099A|nr:T9SS type A sorting domain-containing protein [Flavobacterium sp. SM15]MCG2611583.1 T9SS type A sorting domain-containing protein [Flavobacterium sp. SM15]